MKGKEPMAEESLTLRCSSLPIDWKKVKLSRLVQPMRPITYGIVQAGPNVEGGIPYIRPTDMTDEMGVLNENELLRTSEEIASSYSRSTVGSGDLICSIGPSFGKVMVVPGSLDGANLTQGTARIAISEEAEAKFVFWALRSPDSVHQWNAAIGGATFRALNLEPLARTILMVPPLPEQRAIAAFLDRETAKIDGLVAEQRRLIELLKEKRQSVISHAVTKGLDPTAPTKPSGIDWLGDIPAHWEARPIRKLAQLESGHTPSRSRPDWWQDCYILGLGWPTSGRSEPARSNMFMKPKSKSATWALKTRPLACCPPVLLFFLARRQLAIRLLWACQWPPRKILQTGSAATHFSRNFFCIA